MVELYKQFLGEIWGTSRRGYHWEFRGGDSHLNSFGACGARCRETCPPAETPPLRKAYHAYAEHRAGCR